ncbi:MAG: UDP-glucose 6-dehydrogenase [Candidatus Parcubacteria bacterium]|jgi:nucleotide sugar dehydrogenase
MQTKIGFIGQGWIGKHYADDFEARLYEVVRYSLEEPYVQNKSAIADCDIVFIAVPTPTTPDGFSYAAVEEALTLLKSGATAVIKSTLSPGTTNALQEKFPQLFVFHSPEFLREAQAAHDAAHPDRNLIGMPKDTPEFRLRAETILRVLPEAPYSQVMTAKEAELVKYAGNCFLMTKVLFMNVLYDMTAKSGQSWEGVRSALIHDPRIGESHTQPVHASGHLENKETKVFRGAGGHCFIKDFEAFRQYYKSLSGEDEAFALLSAEVAYNNKLLRDSGKDLDLLRGVYGDVQ